MAHHIIQDDGSFEAANPDNPLASIINNEATGTGLAMATIGNGPHIEVTPTTTVAALSTTTPVPTTTTSASPTPTTTQQPSISLTTSYVTTLPTTSATQASSESGTTHKGTSSAAIGVIVTLLILAICGLAFFLVRKKHIRDRQRRRATWNRGSFAPDNTEEKNLPPPPKDKDVESQFDIIDIDEKGATPLPNHVTYNTLAMPNYAMPSPPKPLHAASFAPPRMPSPPPVNLTADSGIPQLISSTPFAAVKTPHASMTSTTSSALGAQVMTGTLVLVARTFVPTLPDELSIQTGEQVRVITRFDDGWAHVERTRSGAGAENGVVPVECLETVPAVFVTAPGAGLTQEAIEGWRLSKRKSSLVPAGSVQY